MQQLHLVGITTDQDGLIFSARKGSKSGGYVVALDKKLLKKIEDATRRRDAEDHADSRTRPDRVESTLSPREIQARLRSGRTTAQVAREAGVEEEWVTRFAVPIFAEQAQVITRARAMTFSKPRLGESSQPLGEAVLWNTAEKGVRLPDDVFDECWSAFHLRDGEWVVRFAYVNRKKVQHAEWEVDLREGALSARNRLGSELGYVEPGRRRRRLPPAAPPPAAARPAPPKKAAPKKAAPKKAAVKKKAAPKRAALKKRAAPKKAAVRKVAPKKKAAPKKAAPRKAAPKKAALKKKAAPKKAPRKKAAARKVTAVAVPTRSTTTRTVATRPAASPPRRTTPEPVVARPYSARSSSALSSSALPAPSPPPVQGANGVSNGSGFSGDRSADAPIRIVSNAPRREADAPPVTIRADRASEPAVQSSAQEPGNESPAQESRGLIRLPSPTPAARLRRRRPLRAR